MNLVLLPRSNENNLEEILEPGQQCVISGFGYMGYEREWNILHEKLPEKLQELEYTPNRCYDGTSIRKIQFYIKSYVVIATCYSSS